MDKIKNAVVNKVKDMASGMFDFPQIDSDLTVWFIFEGKEYEVSQFNISFGQGVDFKGQPQDEVRGGRILITLTETLPDNIYKWAMTSCMRDGAIQFRSQSSNAPLKVEFTDGYCVNFDRVVSNGLGLKTTLVISSEYTTINGITLDNHWV